MNKELLEAMEVLEKEKNISKDTLIEAIENSLLTACKNHFGKADNVKVTVNPSGCGKRGGRLSGDEPGGCQDAEPQV